MTFRLSDAETYKLVTESIKFKCLWSKKCPRHSHTQAKQVAYEELEKIMNIPGFDKMEIKLNLRKIKIIYMQEMVKIENSQKCDLNYVPSVSWFRKLDDFLYNMNSIPEVCDDNYHSNDLIDTDYYITNNSKSASNMDDEFDEMNRAVYPEENEFEVFGKHVGLQLKSMPLDLALEAEEQIQKYLNELRRQYLQNSPEQNRCMKSPASSTPYTKQNSSFYNHCNGKFPKKIQCTPQIISQLQDHLREHSFLEE